RTAHDRRADDDLRSRRQARRDRDADPARPADGDGRMTLDPRLNVYRDDLADARLRGAVVAARYVNGRAARVVTGRAAVRRRPDPQAETLSFYHYGEPVLVFERTGGQAWCQSLVDGYVGYVAADAIELGPAPP